MTLRDIINKEFEVLNEDKKTTKKVINIFYKLNINLIKPQTENKEQEENDHSFHRDYHHSDHGRRVVCGDEYHQQ